MYNIQHNFSGAKISHNSLMSCERPSNQITFGKRTWHWVCLVIMILAL